MNPSIPLSLLNRVRASLFVLAAGLLSAACATVPNPNPKDPLESFNRAMFGFNEGLDKVVIRPVAKGYETVVPRVARDGVSNVFGNVADVWTSVNNLLQGKPLDAVSDLGRVLVNTTIGFGGLFDWASDMGLEKHEEDFGQTLARWGVGDGAFLVLPVVGPRTLRDGFGWGVDSAIDPIKNIDHVRTRNTVLAMRVVETRAQLLPADRALEVAAIDKYTYVRSAYLQRRRNLIYDGRPPREFDDEVSLEPAPVAGIALDPEAAVSRLVLLSVDMVNAVATDAQTAPENTVSTE